TSRSLLSRESYKGITSAILPHELGDLVRCDAFNEVVVDQDRRGKAASAETLDLDDGPLAIGTRRSRVARTTVLHQRLQHLLGAADVAGRRRAHLHEVS